MNHKSKFKHIHFSPEVDPIKPYLIKFGIGLFLALCAVLALILTI